MKLTCKLKNKFKHRFKPIAFKNPVLYFLAKQAQQALIYSIRRQKRIQHDVDNALGRLYTEEYQF